MLIPLCMLNMTAQAAPLPDIAGLTWHETELTSTLDGATQPIIIGVPDSYEPGAPTPLLVALHTWSSHYRQQPKDYGPEAAERGWLLVLPHFRGPNLTSNPKATEAGGSIAAQHDIIDAVEYMKREYSVDNGRVYLSGASGGGHMSLLMAGKYPDVWAAVCSWCPVTDFRAWHSVGNNYAQHIEAVCGGPPGTSAEVDFEYLRRSPRTFITNVAPTNVLLGHGDRDYTIPTDHSWETYARLRAVGEHRVVFRSWCGGHEAHMAEGLDWASEQRRSATPPRELHIVTDEAKWYFWLFAAPTERLTLGRVTARLDGTKLMLETQAVSDVALDLRVLGRAAPTEVVLDGRPVAGAFTVDGDTLTLAPPDSERHTWELH